MVNSQESVFEKTAGPVRRESVIHYAPPPPALAQLESSAISEPSTSTAGQNPSMPNRCQECGCTFTRRDNFLRHLRHGHSHKESSNRPSCAVCCRTFKNKTGLATHTREMHRPTLTGGYECDKCQKKFKRSYDRVRHEKACGGKSKLNCGKDARMKGARMMAPCDKDGFVTVASAFDERLVTLYLKNTESADCFGLFLYSSVDGILKKLHQYLDKWTALKINVALEATYSDPKLETSANKCFYAKTRPVYQSSDLEEILGFMFGELLQQVENFQENGSGQSLASIDGILLNISQYKPLKGGCHVPLPDKILRRRACDSTNYGATADCFRNAVHAARPESHSNKIYDFSSVPFPTGLKDVKKFEAENDITINIFCLDEKDNVYPIKVVNGEKADHRDLLLIGNDTNSAHYVAIFDFAKLVASQKTRDEHETVICKRCFTHFTVRNRGHERLSEHKRLCQLSGKPARAVMPSNDSKHVSFAEFEKKVKHPIVVYCDTEALLAPISTVAPSSSLSYTEKYQRHQMMSFCTYVECCESDVDSSFNVPYLYRGENAESVLLATLKNIAIKAKKAMNRRKYFGDSLTEEEEAEARRAFNSATCCYLCEQAFAGRKKVLDHDHLSGKYRGAACNDCNLRARRPNFIPVIMHGGSAYDFKFLVSQLNSISDEATVIPHSEEKFISLSIKVTDDDTGGESIWLRLLDSSRFLPASLDSIVKTMDRDEFTLLPSLYQAEKLDLLFRKGVFCYDYITDWSKLDETCLPGRKEFYNKLNASEVTEEDYVHAMRVWDEFGVRTLGEYSDIYLRTDTLLLREVFENFRRQFLNSEYGLDPVHYYGLPGLSWSGMLKITGVTLELLTDYDMLQMIESGIRGGFVDVFKRHAESDDEWQLAYVDANNLYGLGSSSPIAQSDFKFEENVDAIDLLSVPDDAPIGYIAEVDLRIPESKHDEFNSYPLLLEKRKMPNSGYEKLVGTLYTKKRYVLHYKTLQFAIEHGIVLEKVHRIISFRQSRWLKTFIDINTEKRKKATSQFEKDLWKYLNNASFGKSIENVRARMNMIIVTTPQRVEKMVAKPSFVRHTIITPNVAFIHLSKERIVFNKPVYAGFTILEMAKLHMNKFHHDKMSKCYGPERLQLLYTDTDSLIYRIRTRSKGEDWRIEAQEKLGEEFDFSDLPVSHPCHSTANKKVLGKFKDELEGKRLLEIVALRSKMYALRVEGGQEIKKSKGVKRSAVSKQLSFDSYKRILLDHQSSPTLLTTFNAIRSYRHEVFTVRVNKLSLSSKNDKRHVFDDGIHTMAYGHKELMSVD